MNHRLVMFCCREHDILMWQKRKEKNLACGLLYLFVFADPVPGRLFLFGSGRLDGCGVSHTTQYALCF
jgi:hypothetical protein